MYRQPSEAQWYSPTDTGLGKSVTSESGRQCIKEWALGESYTVGLLRRRGMKLY